MALINIKNVSIGFTKTTLIDSADIQIHDQEKICLLGRNGAGKSTLMKLINGDILPDSGEILRTKNIRTALLPQAIPEDIHGTVRDVVTGALQGKADEPENEEENLLQQVKKALSLIDIDPDLRFENLSAGNKRRVLLGRALVTNPDVLLLDEPTNHLDIEAVRWLEDLVFRYNKTVFFVTHDRTFLKKVANRIIELDRGKLFDWKCDYETFLARKEAWLQSEEAQNAMFDKKLAREEMWIRKGVKARRTRNEGRVKALVKMRDERALRRQRQGKVRMEIHTANKSGDIVIETDNITFGYNDTPLIRDFSTVIGRGDKIGIIGPNGCGKSTLVKLLLKDLEPGSGSIRFGTRIERIYFDQLRLQFDENKTVRENVSDNNETVTINGKTRHVIGYLRDFLFSPDMVDVKVSVLSGGERNRLLLAKFFTKPSNFIVMDEPTNDLDIETIELLEELLLEYEGTLLLVSHDRSFLNNIVTGIFSFEGNGTIGEYAGGFDDWLVQRKQAPVEKEKPKETVREKRVPVKRKLSFREKAEFESIPVLIEEKEGRKHEIYSLMANPEFYKQDSSKISEITSELHDLEKELDRLFARWEELEAVDTN
jgi:ATP-binding cassette subfamily F protein uup